MGKEEEKEWEEEKKDSQETRQAKRCVMSKVESV